MLRLKSSLFSSLIMLLSMLFVLGNIGVVATSLPTNAIAQVGDDDDDDDDDGDDDDDDDDDGTQNIFIGNQAGVVIDAKGVLSLMQVDDKTRALWRAHQQQALAKLNPDVAQATKLRKVSLNRLEHVMASRLAKGELIDEEMLFLAGLTKIQYVFAYPETGDIVIAGPAEGFVRDERGRPRGITSGQAILELEDLIVALRAFGPDGKQTPHISVSIDPTQQGLAKMQQFLASVGGYATPRQTKNIVRGLKDSLGQQVVTFHGISPSTHFALVMVEADYRMKLIGIGLEKPPVKIVSYVSKANPAMVSRNAMERWYFVPNYESVRLSEDGLAIELVGDGVKLVGAQELVQQDGTRVDAKKGNRASQVFTESFTRLYAELAQRSPIYAQLRNLIDMTIAAAAIQQQDFFGQTNWQMELFGNESRLSVEVHDAPQFVDTAVNAIWKSRRLMTPVGGGVRIRPMQALTSANLLRDAEGKVAEIREVSLKDLPPGVWWWD